MLSVLNFLPSEQYDITLLLTDVQGDLLPLLPPHVKVLEVPFAPMDRYELQHGRVSALKYALTHFHWLHVFRMLSLRLRWRLSGTRDNFNVRVIRAMMRRVDVAKMPTVFDYAFAYVGGILIGSIVRDLITAPVKAIWCHNEQEIGLLKSGVWLAIHATYTHRFASRQLCECLNADRHPEWAPFEVMPLCLDTNLYYKMAQEGMGFTDDFAGPRILTVGRICYQKGIDIAIRVAAKLKSAGLRFRWYVVGSGEAHGNCVQLVRNMGVSDSFVFLGQSLNPYPFFAQCEVYVQPSRWEAYCLTVAEARAFGKPIVATDFVGAREQLRDGRTGLIVPIDDEESLYRQVARLLTDPILRCSLGGNLGHEVVNQVEMTRKAWNQLLHGSLILKEHVA